ncbi:MAG: hypothetical protein DCF19_06570 [Pseudanabaena frigida]|uniref:Uncharacterized protein n=1 Tax=Pseudanabaena frigida TaxID=945775 RepID=A0A2W4Y6W5_9CYAN|nr:MAG: hypothetical protein DCF19_06570 [Pseudanabaena frigida]
MRINARLEIDYQKQYKKSSRPLQLLKQTGLIGCAEAESDLSVNYKQYLTEYLTEKYSCL